MGSDQQNNNRDCALFFIANATELASKRGPGTVRGVPKNCRCFPVYMLCCICMEPINWTGLPTMDLFSERFDKIRGNTHITSSLVLCL